jgi:hypothetical protein
VEVELGRHFAILSTSLKNNPTEDQREEAADVATPVGLARDGVGDLARQNASAEEVRRIVGELHIGSLAERAEAKIALDLEQ